MSSSRALCCLALAKKHSRPQSLRSFWPAAGIESSGSNHFEITKEITEFCPSGSTQSSSMAHARNGCSQSSRFLPQARGIVGSGDENGEEAKKTTSIFSVQCIIKQLLDSVFVIFRIIEVSVRVISRSRRLRLITPTSTSIILDITKTSSNNCLLLFNKL